MIKVFYDGKCILCRRYKQAVELLDNSKFTWLDANEESSSKMLNIPTQELLADLHVQLSDNSIIKGSAAMTYIIKQIPAASRFSWLMEKDSTKKAIETFHSTSEKLRRRLIKSCPSCKNKSSSI
tara:strand:- start:1378 stop:1749 length:372 start_codon:yes stop_codon:yes gene_type:complete